MPARLSLKTAPASPEVDPAADVIDRGRCHASKQGAPQQTEQDRPVGADDGVETIEVTRVSDHDALLTGATGLTLPADQHSSRSHAATSLQTMCYRNDLRTIAALAGLMCIPAGLVSGPCRQVPETCGFIHQSFEVRPPHIGRCLKHRQVGRLQLNRIDALFSQRFPS